MLNIVKIGSNAKGNEVIWQMIIKQRKKIVFMYQSLFIYYLYMAEKYIYVLKES